MAGYGWITETSICHKETIKQFITYLMEMELSQNTVDSYMTALELYFREHDDINKLAMLQFKEEQQAKWKPKTVNIRIIALNKYCTYIGHPEYCVKKIKIHKSSAVENVITAEEYNALLDGLKKDSNEKGYWMIKYLAKTGARVSEFTRLTKDGLGKGYCEMWTKGKVRRIYIPQALIDESRDYFEKQGSEYLFPSRSGKQMTNRGVAENIKRWAAKYGIRGDVAHPHSFRHLYAIEFLKRNNNIALLADLMGHASVDTTSIYLRLSMEEQQKQFNEASDW